MRLGNTITSLLPLATLTLAQTPPNYPPSTSTALTVTYANGSLIITPNQLVPQDLTTTQPKISLPRRRPCAEYGHNTAQAAEAEKYMILMFDISLSLAHSSIPIPSNITSVAAPGLDPNRTTYLHWFQGNLTHCDGSLVAEDEHAIAPYIMPSPNEGNVQHTYVFYLLRQPEGFVLPEEYAGREFYGQFPLDRIGVDVRPVARVAGGVLAAVYFRERAVDG